MANENLTVKKVSDEVGFGIIFGIITICLYTFVFVPVLGSLLNYRHMLESMEEYPFFFVLVMVGFCVWIWMSVKTAFWSMVFIATPLAVATFFIKHITQDVPQVAAFTALFYVGPFLLYLFARPIKERYIR